MGAFTSITKESSNKSKPKIRVLLAEDHHIIRAGIRQLLVGDLHVIAEAGEGEESQALFQNHPPEVVVLHIQMQNASEIEVTRWVYKFTRREGSNLEYL